MLDFGQILVLSHENFRHRITTLWLLVGGILALVMLSSAIRRDGLRGFVRRCAFDLQHDWRDLIERPSDHQLSFAQRWCFWYLELGAVNMFVLSLDVAYREQDPNHICIQLAIFLYVLALFSLVGMYVDARLDAERFNHLRKGHPLLARMFCYKGLGPEPQMVSYRRECKRVFCILR